MLVLLSYCLACVGLATLTIKCTEDNAMQPHDNAIRANLNIDLPTFERQSVFLKPETVVQISDMFKNIDNNATHDNKIRAHLNATYKPEKLSAKEYMARYPELYQTFERLAFQALNKGYTKIGARMIAEVMRWEHMIKGDRDYAVNNDIVPAMARRFMDENPLYGKVFETRERH